ncbi:MAG: GGDEF domain-containing protein [Bradymonadales bacterium]|nr:MAG: GGDEF domain-containing protein [Bradymonadales bacterium]
MGGAYFLNKDLSRLYQRPSEQLKEIAALATNLIPQQEIENSLETKNEHSPSSRQLQSTLNQLKANLRPQIEISVLHDDSGQWRVLQSSSPNWRMGDLQPHLSEAGDLALRNRQPVASALERDGSRYWSRVWQPLDLNGLALVVESDESATQFQARSLLLNYLAMGIVLLLLSGLVFFWLSRKRLEEVGLLSSLSERLLLDSAKSICVINHQGECVATNPNFAQRLWTDQESLHKQNLFSPDYFGQVTAGSKTKALSLESLLAMPSKSQILNLQSETGEQCFVKLSIEELEVSGLESKPYYLIELEAVSRTSLTQSKSSAWAYPSEEDFDFVDQRTKLPNRSYLFHALSARMNFLQNIDCSMMLIELDQFTHFIELFGKETGEAALKAWAEFLRGYFRQSDLVVHFEETRFLVVLEQTESNQALRIAHNLKNSMKESRHQLIQGMSFSISVTSYQKPESFQSWLARSEIALQRASNRGFGQIEVDTPLAAGPV